MAYTMPRVIVHDHEGAFIQELNPNDILELTSKDEINGEHSLSVRSLVELQKTDRLVLQDRQGLWHEYVVTEIDTEHSDGGLMVYDHYAVWSLMYDLSATFVNNQYGAGLVPGRESNPVPASQALMVALEGTSRWLVGNVTVTTMGSGSFYRQSGWEAIKTLLENWGGEINARITLEGETITRYVDLLDFVGHPNPTRRFDYGHDVTGIKRIVSKDIWPCRIVPLGKSEETEAGGYTRRQTIESVNDGVLWVQDDNAVPYTRVPDGNGGWEYPTLIVKNDAYSDPAALKAWAQSHVTDYTKPIVSYEVNVAQMTQAGMNASGVALGDAVIVVDRTFGDDGLSLSARAVKVEQNLLDPTDTKLTLGNATETLGKQMRDLSRQVGSLTDQVGNTWEYQRMTTWVTDLVGRINSDINATGGYTYITEGEGLRTYDVPVEDPTTGYEASQVVEVKGGSIRIANSKTAGGEWDWKTLLVSGFINADLIAANAIVTDRLVSATDSTKMIQFVNGVDETGNTTGDYSGLLYKIYGSGNTVSMLAYEGLVWPGTSSTMTMKKFSLGLTGMSVLSANTYYTGGGSFYSSSVRMQPERSDTTSEYPVVDLGFEASGSDFYIGMRGPTSSSDQRSGISIGNGSVDMRAAPAGGGSWSASSMISLGTTGFSMYINGYASGSYALMSATSSSVSVRGSLSVSGTKNRVVGTEGYGERLLYSYETPAPMFGDVGSGTIGDDGLAYVGIDPVFAETARTDLAYHVFLQKCGDGDLWVEEKHATHFVVRGTAGLAFDWELKARQAGYESVRLEERDLLDLTDEGVESFVTAMQEPYAADEYAWAESMETIAYEGATND